MQTETVCTKCGGRGYIVKPVDGKKKVIKCECSVHTELSQTKEVPLEEGTLEAYVPSKYYQEKDYDVEEIQNRLYNRLPQELIEDLRYKKYFQVTQQLQSMFEVGGIPKKSYFLMSPHGFGKKLFVYDAIKRLLKRGKNPSKFYTTQEIYMLMENKQYDEMNKIVKDHDIVFIDLGERPGINDVIGLDDLRGKCARNGTPMICVSRHGIGYFKRFDVMLSDYMGVQIAENYQYGYLVRAGLDDEYMTEYFKYVSKREGMSRGGRRQADPYEREDEAEVTADDLFNDEVF